MALIDAVLVDAVAVNKTPFRAYLAAREILSVKDTVYGAVGDNVADDTAEIQAAATAAEDRALYVPNGTFKVTTQIELPSNIKFYGDGNGSIITCPTLNTTILYATGRTHVFIRDLKLVGNNAGNNHTFSSGVWFTNCSYSIVERCDISGVAGHGVHLDGTGSTRCVIRNNSFHSWQASALQDSADVALYDGPSHNIVTENIMLGGGWHGVLNQAVTAAIANVSNIISHNVIGAHLCYGIVCYQLSHLSQWTHIDGNTVYDIDGAVLAGSAGAGIYCVGTGAIRITSNRVRNCNISTTAYGLAPAAIGINGVDGAGLNDYVIANNLIEDTDWHGIMIVSCTFGHFTLTGNTLTGVKRDAIYLWDALNVSVTGNNVNSASTATGGCFRCRGDGATNTDITVSGNVFKSAANVNTVDITKTTRLTFGSNDVLNTHATGIAVQIATAVDQVTMVGNTMSQTVAAAVVTIIAATKVRMSANVLKNTGGAAMVSTSGVCTDGYYDESNIGTVTTMSNAGTGFIINLVGGAAAPVSGTHALGDRLVNRTAPAVGSAKAFVCTVAGSPGTWVSEGNL